MRAAVCREFGKSLIIEEINLAPPKKGQVEVVVEACAVCHSDIHFIDGAWGGALPAVYGHEAVGRIVQLGGNVNHWAVGDRVLVTLLKSCGHCHQCSEGLPARCESDKEVEPSPLSRLNDSPITHGLNTGAFAERVVVDQSQIAKIPETIASESACLLSCGVITGIGAAVNTAQIHPGAIVAVVGAGGVGLNAIQGAKICGASTIIAVDKVEQKIADAIEFGATHGILSSSEKPHRQIKSLTQGRGVDFVLVTVGAIEAFKQSMRYLNRGGKLVIVGMPPSGDLMSIEPMAMAYMSQSLIGSMMGDTVLKRDIPWLLSLYEQGRLKLDELVTGRYPLDKINDAIQNTVEGKARRNVIVF